MLQRFLDSEGQVQQWPAKRINQSLVLEYLATKFDPKQIYDEKQVNHILKTWHTFGDWAVLRRALIDESFMARDLNGSNYHRTTGPSS